MNEFAKTFFPLDNIDLMDKANKKGKLRLYYRIVKKSKLTEFMPPRLTYKIDDRNSLNLLCEYDLLKAMIDLAFAKAVTDDKKPLRTCKRCGKLFYATDIRSEFCSARCRNQYNVYKSRAKH